MSRLQLRYKWNPLSRKASHCCKYRTRCFDHDKAHCPATGQTSPRYIRMLGLWCLLSYSTNSSHCIDRSCVPAYKWRKMIFQLQGICQDQSRVPLEKTHQKQSLCYPGLQGEQEFQHLWADDTMSEGSCHVKMCCKPRPTWLMGDDRPAYQSLLHTVCENLR